jgi:alkanesulfonate monooxygenase SsuD/methylene tetrahydromethanopterin reductase-like flavin-dependent oxidoreductase (luciferase family)
MRFSIIFVTQVREGQPEPFDDLMDQIELADELGYETAWLTEHHFGSYGRSATSALAGHAIARTERIRIGNAVVVLPLHHPLRVAEDWATLDHLAKGRLDVGVGRGSQPAEFAGFGVPLGEARERFDESLEIIRAAWTKDSFAYDGEFWSFPELSVLPKPYQDPHPPIWQAAVSAYTVQMIVDNGLNGFVGPYLCPYDILDRDYFSVWRDATAKAGHTESRMAHNEFLYVGETERQVKEDVEDAVMWYVRKAAKVWGERDRSKVVKQFENYNELLEFFEVVTFDEVYESLAMFGTPDRVAEKIRWMRDVGRIDHLINFMNFGGLPHDKVMRNIELFATEVMPEFVDLEVEPTPT